MGDGGQDRRDETVDSYILMAPLATTSKTSRRSLSVICGLVSQRKPPVTWDVCLMTRPSALQVPNQRRGETVPDLIVRFRIRPFRIDEIEL